MSKRNTAEFSVQDAWQQAVAEEAGTSMLADSSGVDAPPVPNAGPSDNEQAAVESKPSRSGLFADLEVEGNMGGSTPPDNGGLHPVKVRGETVMVSYDELVAGYSRTEDYTRDKQALKAEKDEFNDALTLWRSLQEDYDQTVAALWQGRGKGGVPKTPAGSVAAGSVEDIDAIVQRKLEERLASDPRIVELEREREFRAINARFDELEVAYEVELTDDDRIMVFNHALEAGHMDFEASLAVLLQRKAQADKRKQNAAANSTVGGYGGNAVSAAAPKPSERRFSSWSEAMADTLAEENLSMSQLEAVIARV